MSLSKQKRISKTYAKTVYQPTSSKKANYDKKANDSKLKNHDYVYVLQPKAYHQSSEILYTDFRWIGPYIAEEALPNNNYLVRKIGTNKTQVFPRMRLPTFTPEAPIPDVQTTPKEKKLDPEVTLKHDDLYARAWESNLG